MLVPSSPSSRRRFLLGSTGALLGAGAWHFSSGNAGIVRRRQHALGAAVTMTVAHEDRDGAESALDAAFAELELIESVMSLYRPESELCRLNQDSTLENPHPHLLTVLNHAAQISEKTGGAFDVTVQPLWELYRSSQTQNRLPDEAEVMQARAFVDWQRVKITAERIQLDGAGTAVTLNGIAQGFAADAVTNVLRRAGIEHALIDAGEMNALGSKPDGQAWRVGIQHPRQPDAFVSMAKLQGRCLATSGDYETRFSDDYAHHHLFDPRTGHSPNELASVSIAAPTAMMADALSTAVFVLGAERGLELVRRTPGVDVLVVLKNGKMEASRGFPLA